MTSLAVLLAVAAAAAWAIGMTAAKPALRYMDRLTYMVGRWSFVVALALTYALVRGEFSFPSVRAVLMAVVAGVVDASLGGLLFLMAMERTSAHQTTTLSSTAPLWGVVGSILLLGEPLRWSVFVAAGLVLAGAYYLVERGARRIEGALTGALLALLAGVLWGVAETVPSKLALQGGLAPATMLFVFALSGVLGTLVLLPALRRSTPRRVNLRGVRLMALSAVGGAFLGWILWLNSLELAPASLLSPIRGATMLFAFVYSIVFLGERPTGRSLVGVLLVSSGVLLVSFAP